MRVARWVGVAVVAVAAGAGGCRVPGAAWCLRPAPLLGRPDAAAPGYIVMFRAGAEPRAEAARLAAKYGFAPTAVWGAPLSGFAAAVPPRTAARLRCEPSVDHVSHDEISPVDGAAPRVP